MIKIKYNFDCEKCNEEYKITTKNSNSMEHMMLIANLMLNIKKGQENYNEKETIKMIKEFMKMIEEEKN